MSRVALVLIMAAAGGFVLAHGTDVAAVDVKISMDDARKAVASGRTPMETAKTPEDVKKILHQRDSSVRVGSDPETAPCGPYALLRTKRYWLDTYGQIEATESKKQNHEVRAPEEKLQKVLDMPNLEISFQLCGDDEYFADGAQVVMQQGGKTVKPIDVGPAEKGRQNERKDESMPAYRSRFTARFAYDTFDPMAKTKFLINLMDGKQIEFDADLSKVR